MMVFFLAHVHLEWILFSLVYFSRGTLPPKRVQGHYWET